MAPRKCHSSGSLPLLQKVLGVLDLLVTPRDGDNTVIRAGTGVFYADGTARISTDLADASSSLADDCASSILGDGHL